MILDLELYVDSNSILEMDIKLGKYYLSSSQHLLPHSVNWAGSCRWVEEAIEDGWDGG